MTDTIPDGFLRDPQGRHCPIENIRPQDLLVDQTVQKIKERALKISGDVADYREQTLSDIFALVDIMREKYGSNRGGKKGNITFKSFDGLTRVEIKQQDRIDFGPELQIAKELIDECIGSWAADSGKELRAIVNHAFSVDKVGKVNREAILSLRRVEIDDDRWRRAMDAINDSIRVLGSKRYVHVHQRADADSTWEIIPVNVAHG